MKNNSSKQIWATRFALAAVSCLAIAQTTFGQYTVERKSSACTAPDKLEIASFSISPSQPSIGQPVTVSMKIRNKCPSGTSSLNVPWLIKKDSYQMSSGTVSLAAGATSGELTANWTAATGTFTFWGAADPNKTISETERNNNTTSDHRITVQPVLVSQLLNHVKAKNSGTSATFRINNVDNPTCRIGVGAGHDNNITMYGGYGNEQVAVIVDCRQHPSGSRAEFALYGGYFRLKNGWKVKSYEAVQSPDSGLREGSGKGWSWMVTPKAGDDVAYITIKLWADANRGIQMFVRITIEGPQGTDPYQ